jgi:hypothetical protein
MVREIRLPGFDEKVFVEPQSKTQMDMMMLDSPNGPLVDIGNAVQQYLYVRDCLRDIAGED